MKFKNKIEVESGILIPSGAGSGKVLTSDGSGNGTWGSAPGGAIEVATGPSTPARTTELLWIDTDEVAVPPTPVAFVSSLPLSPVDGQEVYFQNAAMATDGVIWHLRYRAGSGSAYKWEYLGGAEIRAEADGGGAIYTTSATAYLATQWTTPSITFPLAGDYDLEGMLGGFFGGATNDLRLWAQATTGTTTGYSAGFLSTDANSRGFHVIVKSRWFGVAAGSFARLYYASAGAGYSFTGYPRHIYARPVRVG